MNSNSGLQKVRMILFGFLMLFMDKLYMSF